MVKMAVTLRTETLFKLVDARVENAANWFSQEMNCKTVRAHLYICCVNCLSFSMTMKIVEMYMIKCLFIKAEHKNKKSLYFNITWDMKACFQLNGHH